MTTQQKRIAINCGGSYVPGLNAVVTGAVLAADGGRTAVTPQSSPERAVVRAADVAHVDVDGRSVAVRLAAPPDVDRAAQAAARSHPGGPLDILAPMPGRIVAVHVATGDAVDAGAPVVTLEAMKMEHLVTAPIAGQAEGLVAVGDQVERASRLATIRP